MTHIAFPLATMQMPMQMPIGVHGSCLEFQISSAINSREFRSEKFPFAISLATGHVRSCVNNQLPDGVIKCVDGCSIAFVCWYRRQPRIMSRYTASRRKNTNSIGIYGLRDQWDDIADGRRHTFLSICSDIFSLIRLMGLWDR